MSLSNICNPDHNMYAYHHMKPAGLMQGRKLGLIASNASSVDMYIQFALLFSHTFTLLFEL